MSFVNNKQQYYVDAAVSIAWFEKMGWNLKKYCEIKNPYCEGVSFLAEASNMLNNMIDEKKYEAFKMYISNDVDRFILGDWYDIPNMRKLLISFASCDIADLKNYMLMFKRIYYDLGFNMRMISSYYIVKIYKILSDKKNDTSILDSNECVEWLNRFYTNINRRETELYKLIQQ